MPKFIGYLYMEENVSETGMTGKIGTLKHTIHGLSAFYKLDLVR